MKDKRDFKWYVAGYYNSTVEPPKSPGDLAIEIGANSRAALDMDVFVLILREDIGRVVITDPNGFTEEQ